MEKYQEDLKKYRLLYDIHTHTTFSHGKGSIEDNVIVARDKGLEKIGISDHGPGHLFYGVKKKKIDLMRKEVERLKPLYPSVEILLGLEANIINPSGRLDISWEEWKKFDYVIAGYHYGILGENPLLASRLHLANLAHEKMNLKKNSKLKARNTDLVLRAIYTNRIKVLTHPGDKGPFDLEEIARACEETGTLMEISTWHPAPTLEELKKLARREVKFIISSDAHSPQRVGSFRPGLRRALMAKIDPARIVNIMEV